MDCLRALVSIHKPDAIHLWLYPDITAAEISLLGYSAARLDRDRHGSGIILFVADILQCESPATGSVFLRLGISSCVCSVCTINKDRAGHPSAPQLYLAGQLCFFCVCVSVQCAQFELSLAVLY